MCYGNVLHKALTLAEVKLIKVDGCGSPEGWLLGLPIKRHCVETPVFHFNGFCCKKAKGKKRPKKWWENKGGC